MKDIPIRAQKMHQSFEVMVLVMVLLDMSINVG